MLKYTEDVPECEAELKEALNTMLGLLKYVNDLMHQIAIKGFPVSEDFITVRALSVYEVFY